MQTGWVFILQTGWRNAGDSIAERSDWADAGIDRRFDCGSFVAGTTQFQTGNGGRNFGGRVAEGLAIGAFGTDRIDVGHRFILGHLRLAGHDQCLFGNEPTGVLVKNRAGLAGLLFSGVATKTRFSPSLDVAMVLLELRRDRGGGFVLGAYQLCGLGRNAVVSQNFQRIVPGALVGDSVYALDDHRQLVLLERDGVDGIGRWNFFATLTLEPIRVLTTRAGIAGSNSGWGDPHTAC